MKIEVTSSCGFLYMPSSTTGGVVSVSDGEFYPTTA
jgi:hypothetical protein